MIQENEATLEQGISKIGLKLSNEQLIKLVKYHDLLFEMNAKFNLTGFKDERKSVIFNLLNSLAALGVLIEAQKGLKSIADVGSGGGFPGIPWAIVLEKTRILLVESKEKKANFLKSVKSEIGLTNATIINKNIFEVKQKFDNFVFQAFGKIEKTIKLVEKSLKINGFFFIFASSTENIVKALQEKKFSVEIIPFTIPFAEDHTRNLLICQ